MIKEFPNFYSWLLDKGFDEYDLDNTVDSAYNSDTYLSEIVLEVCELYVRIPKTPSKPRIKGLIKQNALWTVQDRETPEAKKVVAIADKYASQYTTYIAKNWKKLVAAYVE